MLDVIQRPVAIQDCVARLDPRSVSFYCDTDDDGNVIDVADTPAYCEAIVKLAARMADELELGGEIYDS